MPATEVKVNRVKCTAKVSGIMDAFYEKMFDGRLVCWCVGATPYELFSAANIARFQVENASARIAASQEQRQYIEYAEGQGLGTAVCSYAKINIGQALMMVNGLEEKIAARFRLPRPNMVFALNTCPTMIQWAECLSEIFSVPLFVVDAPFFYDEAKNWERNVAYVKRQLKELVAFLEKTTGQPYDWAALRSTLESLRQMSAYRRRIAELCKVRPAPGGFIDAAVGMGPGNTVRDETAVAFYREFAEEMAERVRNGISSLPEEKYRIMWRGNFPWFKLGALSRMLAKYGAFIVSGPYALRTYGDVARDRIPPDGFDLDDPLWTVAAEHCGRSYTRTFTWKLKDEFRDFIEGYAIDAVIIHAPHTCRPWALTAYDLARAVEREFGLPVLVLDADHTDPSYFQDSQVETRIQALLEAVEARRR